MNNLQIEYFLAVAENLSFTKTAEEKYVSQPAISKQITAMEEELGVLLFERGRKQTVLTDAGKLFVEFYRRQRAEFDLISQQVNETQKNTYVSLRVAFGSGWTLDHFMPGIVKKVREEVPATKINLISDELIKLETMLLKDQADVIILPWINIHPTPNIEVRPLAKIPGVFLYSKNHPAAGWAKSPGCFQNEVFVVPIVRELDYIISLVNSFVEPYGFTPKIQRVGNVGSMIANVINGLGVAIVDNWIVDKDKSTFLTMPISSEYTIVAAWKKDNKSRALKVFLDELFSLPPEALI